MLINGHGCKQKLWYTAYELYYIELLNFEINANLFYENSNLIYINFLINSLLLKE